MEKIPILICIDVEPDDRQTDPRMPEDWNGFEKTFQLFQELRPRLENITQSTVHFSWFLRMDPQIARTYRSPEWPVRRYRDHIETLQSSGDEIGLHTHAWRWDEDQNQWFVDLANQDWIDHCVRMSFEAFESSLKRRCLSFRFGNHWMNDATLDLLESLGVHFDITVEPGRREFFIPDKYIGALPDYSEVPQSPYRPSKKTFIEAVVTEKRELWIVPLSICDADRTFAAILGYPESSGNGNGDRGKSKQQVLKPVYEGFLDKADRQAIEGWVYDVRDPNRPLEVQILEGATVLGTFTADGLRTDLLDAGKGNGRHAFSVPTPSFWKDDGRRTIRVKVANSNFELAGSPKELDVVAASDEGGLLLLGMDPWRMGKSVDVLLRTLEKPYLALPMRSDAPLDPSQMANLVENLEFISSHPLAKSFVFETPAGLVKRMR